MYAIINEVGQYLRVFNLDPSIGFISATWETEPPFQTVSDLANAQAVLDLLKQKPLVNWDGEGKEPRIINCF